MSRGALLGLRGNGPATAGLGFVAGRDMQSGR